MKAALCVLAILAHALAMPSSHIEIDWSKVKPIEVFVEPLPDAKPDISARVVGGIEAHPHSFPYQVAIVINGVGFCGASLISLDWLLSAAHCTVSASYVQAILGAHDIRIIEDTQIVATSRAITNHPDYNPNTFLNDISLIRLPIYITLTAAIRVIPLAPATSGTFAGSRAVLTGWGRVSDASNTISPTLQRVSLSVISNDVCQSTFGTLIQPSTLCTSGSGGVGACDGDSGGPLIISNMQVGIVSFGANSGCQSGLPSAYVRISSFRSWISSVAGI